MKKTHDFIAKFAVYVLNWLYVVMSVSHMLFDIQCQAFPEDLFAFIVILCLLFSVGALIFHVIYGLSGTT